MPFIVWVAPSQAVSNVLDWCFGILRIPFLIPHSHSDNPLHEEIIRFQTRKPPMNELKLHPTRLFLKFIFHIYIYVYSWVVLCSSLPLLMVQSHQKKQLDGLDPHESSQISRFPWKITMYIWFPFVPTQSKPINPNKSPLGGSTNRLAGNPA